MNNLNEKISPFQMIALIYPTIIASAVLMKPAVTAETAGREMWLSPLLASIYGIVAIFLAIKLSEAYPKESIIQYSTKIIGKIPGKLLGILYLYILLHINGAHISEYAVFVTGNFLQKTPTIIIVASIVFVCSLAVRSGVEVLARSSEIFFPILVFIFFSIFLLLIPEFEMTNILPMFEDGLTPSIKAVFSPQSWYSELFLITFFLPTLTNDEKKWKYMFFILILVAVELSLANLAILLTFDMFSKQLTYPIVSAVRYISFFDFLEDIDSVIMALWVGAAYIKIGVYYYCLVIGTAQWLNLPNYRPLTFPIGILLVVFGIWIADGFTQLGYSLGDKFPFFLPFIIYIFIPAILYFIHLLKSKLTNKKENKNAVEM